MRLLGSVVPILIGLLAVPLMVGRVEATGAHHADESHVRGIFHARRTSQIRGAIAAPVTGKTDNGGFELFSHRVLRSVIARALFFARSNHYHTLGDCFVGLPSSSQ